MVALNQKCYYFKGNRKPWRIFSRGIKSSKLCFKSLPLEDGRIGSFRLLSLHKKHEINYGKTSQRSTSVKQIYNQEKGTLKMVEGGWCFYSPSPILFLVWRKWLNSQFPPSGWKEQNGTCLQCSSLSLGCLGDEFQSHLTWRSDRKQWKPLKAMMGIMVCEHCRETAGLWIHCGKRLWTDKYNRTSKAPKKKLGWDTLGN